MRAARQISRRHPRAGLPNALTNGGALSPDGRLFLVVAKQTGQDVPQIAEYVGGTRTGSVFEGGQLNRTRMPVESVEASADASKMFPHANSLRF